MHVLGHEYFIPTKFHKHPLSGSVVKADSGVSNYFSSGARLKTVGARSPEAEGFTSARSAERGRVGEGVTPSRRRGYGGPPPENFRKIASKWCILVRFGAVNSMFQNRKFI